MAFTAKKKPNKPVSYAEAAKTAVGKKSFFDSAVCNLTLPLNVPHKHIPNTNEAFSFFVDLNSTNATKEEVAKAITVEGILRVNVRNDLRVVEFICRDEETLETALGATFRVPGKKPFVAIVPRHRCNKYILVKLSNVPIEEEEGLKTKLEEHWCQFGRVVSIAPYKFPGKEWLTKRWDLVVQLKAEEKKLVAPTVFKVSEQQVIASWPKSAKTCLGCKATGHSTSLCPRRNPKSKKVGESVNPLQKIGKGGQSQKGKEKESEVSTGPSEKVKASTPATRTTPATTATGSASGKAIQPPKPSEGGAPENAAAKSSAMEDITPFGPELLQGTSVFVANPVER